MIEKVLSFIEQHHMIDKGEHILVGVSGGADSVCLLLVLEEIRKKYDCTLTVAHVEHGIRGQESKQDADFVKMLCEKYGIAYRVFYGDAIAFSKERGMSLEEGARELRYEYFKELLKELGADKIAIAHNQNDCAETLLFHLARGTGLRGMCGIVPVRGNIIRPLLGISREEIQEFLEKKKQGFCLDSTNLDLAYSRNKIRHQVLPVLKEVNAGAVEHIFQSARYMSEAVELMEELVKQAKQQCVKEKAPGVFLLREELTGYPESVQKNLILDILGVCAGSRKDIGNVHVLQIRELFLKQTGKLVNLPYHMQGKRCYEGIILSRIPQEKGLQEVWQDISIQPGQAVELPDYNLTIAGRIINGPVDFKEIPQKTYTKWFDYDKIKDILLLRKRSSGDYFIVNSKGGKQSLKKYFINEKISAEDRENVLLLAEGSHVLWIIGYRISEAYKVTDQTKRILEIQISGGNTDE